MKNRFFKHSLVALAIGGLGMLSSVAYADHDRYDNDRYGHVQDRDFGRWHDRDDFRRSEDFKRQIDARQDRQKSRIIAGKRSGELTHREFRDLMQTQREIRHIEARFLADGYLDHREFRRLDRALDRASRDIRAEKNDHQARNHRGDHGPWYN